MCATGTDLAPPTTRPMSASSLRMTKVVAPSDTNHMLNTFGGNVMAWMDDAATVAALKHCRYTPLGNHVNVVTIAVDAMQFHGGSKVGDHITCFAQVNRAFGSTMEVGVRVEAQCLGGDVRHINTGYVRSRANRAREAIVLIDELDRSSHSHSLRTQLLDDNGDRRGDERAD